MSLLTLFIGLGGSAAVYTLGKTFDKIIACFLAYVALMQGIEWLLWRHQTCDNYHRQVSFMGMLLNTMQPFVLGCLSLIFSPRAAKNKEIILSLMFLNVFCNALFFKAYKKDLQCTTPRPNDPHLVWNWTILPYYWIFWIVYIVIFSLIMIFGMPTLYRGIVFSCFGVLTMSISIIVYPRQDMGAMWCFFTTFIPILYYITSKMKLIIM